MHITTVSINGSNSDTNPSEAAYFVLTAECAIDADPAPASFEKAALLNPTKKNSYDTSDSNSGWAKCLI